MQGSGIQNASYNVDFLKHLDELNYTNDSTIHSQLRVRDIGGHAEQLAQNVQKIHISKIKWSMDHQGGHSEGAGLND